MEIIWAAFACWRLTSILHHEKISDPIRKKIGANEIAEGIWSFPDTFIGYLFSCFWCLSVWVSGLCAVLLVLDVRLLYPFVLSAIAIGIEEIWQFVQSKQ